MRFYFLVVDDDAAVAVLHRILLEHVLNNENLLPPYNPGDVAIDIADSASKAELLLAKRLSADPDQVVVCLMDQRMAGERGTTFIDRIRLSYAAHSVGALLLSAYGEDVEVQSAREFGFYRFLSKPITSSELKVGIALLLRKLFSRIVPSRKAVEYPYIVRPFRTQEEMKDYLKLRYEIYGPDGLNVLPNRFHNEHKIEC